MDFSLKHDRLLSFAASAMITASLLATAPAPTVSAAAGPQPAAVLSALEGLKSAGFQGIQNFTPPMPAVSPQSSAPTPPAEDPVLSPARIQKLDKSMAPFGVDSVYDKRVTDVLGLTKGVETLPIRQLTVDGQGPIDIRGFCRVPKSDRFLLSVRTTDQHLLTFFTDSNVRLISAVELTTAGVTAIPVADAQAKLKTELVFWAGIADQVGGQVATSH